MMPAKTRPNRIYPLMMALVLLGGILFFGLRPKDLTLSNNVRWLTDENGIHFRKYSIAFSPSFLASGTGGISEENDFSIELALKPKVPPADGFSILLALDNGDDSRQLVVGQWRSWLVVMNGNDYAYKKRIKRLAVDTALLPADRIFITIAVDSGGTHIYANGKKAVEKNDVILKIPAGDKTRVIVGNSAYGTNSWQGNVYGLTIYNRRLAENAVSAHYRRWSAGRSFGYALQARPQALYLFDEKAGVLARDHAGGAHLELPKKMRALRRRVLAPPWEDFEFNRSLIVDVVLNVIAFIPLGFVLAAVLRGWGGPLKAHALLTAAGLCVLTSLFIEISQSWMPSRSSTLLDLILNTLGALTGVVSYRVYNWHRGGLKAKW